MTTAQQVQADRMDEYGRCEDCGQITHEDELVALPLQLVCVECAEEIKRKGERK